MSRKEDEGTIKFARNFLNWLDDSILKSTFPIKYKSHFTTICTFYWVKKFQKTKDGEKPDMLNELKGLYEETKNLGYLKENSRKLKKDDEIEDVGNN